MRFTLSVLCPTTATHTGAALDLGNYISGGSHPNLLRLEYAQNAVASDGDVSSLLVQHDTNPDFGTAATLWDVGDPDSATLSYKVLYSWNRHIRLSADYTASSSTIEDVGARLTVTGWVWGPPGWQTVSVCRPTHVRQLKSPIVDTSTGMPAEWSDAHALAKAHIENVLRGRGVDPNKLLTDGHNTRPCIEGLEIAGAALVVFYVLSGSKAVSSDLRTEEIGHFYDFATSQLELALTGGLLTEDVIADLSPDSSGGESISRPMGVVI